MYKLEKGNISRPLIVGMTSLAILSLLYLYPYFFGRRGKSMVEGQPVSVSLYETGSVVCLETMVETKAGQTIKCIAESKKSRESLDSLANAKTWLQEEIDEHDPDKAYIFGIHTSNGFHIGEIRMKVNRHDLRLTLPDRYFGQ